MTKIDHDAIAATIRAYLATGGDGLLPDLPGAYLDLYDDRARIAAEWAEASQRNYQRAKSAEAEREALRAALEEIADGLKGIARDIQIGPDDEGREIYDMVQAMQWDARQALKGQTNE